MSAAKAFLAVDLGAESGRAVLGRFDGRRLELEEIHRFSNGPVRVLDTLHWDVLRLWDEIKRGIGLAGQKAGGGLASLGVDTWGVDFGLLGRGDVLLANPTHYRDHRTDGMLDEAFRRVSRQEIFERTGIQFMQLNTLYQLLSMRVARSPILDAATTLLTMPDLFNFLLTGRKVAEFTNATTTQCYDPRRREWARELLQKLDLPGAIFPEIVPSGTNLGPLLASVAEDVGMAPVSVIAPACHDTGSAVAAVPASGVRGQGSGVRERGSGVGGRGSGAEKGNVIAGVAAVPNWCYLSSGTWSLMGVEVAEPVINDRALRYNFTNEGGVGGTIRLLKNIMGLWLVQQCRRAWSRGGEDLSYDQIVQLAEQAAPFGPVVDPDDTSFLNPPDMPAAIGEFCRRTGQPPPQDRAATVRCALESLALKYRWVMERLEELIGGRLEVIHVVGGGSQNRLLCQLTADACGRPVVAGPVEATALGNVLVQAIAVGEIASLGEARELVRRSVELRTYEPRPAEGWSEAYARFAGLMGAGS